LNWLHGGGAWVFRVTRIPVAALFETLEDGISLLSLSSFSQASRKSKPAWCWLPRQQSEEVAKLLSS